jgi:hypothetical protein
MMLRSKLDQEPHFVEKIKVVKLLKIRSLGRKRASISNFPGS